ncbi:MAG: cupin [Chloroflexi bacterium]|nr:cupin [Chloroflexota bacterium]
MTRGVVEALLAAEGLVATRWSSGPGDRYAAHRHGFDKVIVAVEGSIGFGLPELQQDVQIERGDRLHLPAGTLHSATAGPSGVVCLEAHLDAGQLGPQARHLAAWTSGEAAQTDPVGRA